MKTRKKLLAVLAAMLCIFMSANAVIPQMQVVYATTEDVSGTEVLPEESAEPAEGTEIIEPAETEEPVAEQTEEPEAKETEVKIEETTNQNPNENIQILDVESILSDENFDYDAMFPLYPVSNEILNKQHEIVYDTELTEKYGYHYLTDDELANYDSSVGKNDKTEYDEDDYEEIYINEILPAINHEDSKSTESEETLTPEEREAIDNFYNNNFMMMNSLETESQTNTMQMQQTDKVQLQPSPDTSSVMSSSVMTASSLATTGYATASAFKSPYSVSNNTNESVVLNTGSLSFTYPVLSLPGRNGLDVNLSLTYNSAKARINDSEAPSNTANESMLFTYGIGWKLNLPYVSDDVLIMADQRSFDITANGLDRETIDFTYTTIADADLTDEWRNLNIGSKLSYKSGRTDYFDKDGYVVLTTDAYNNKIRYNYTNIIIQNGTTTNISSNVYEKIYDLRVVDSIIDTLNRTIDFEYTVEAIDVDESGAFGDQITEIKISSGDVCYGIFSKEFRNTNVGPIGMLSKIRLDNTNGQLSMRSADYEYQFEYDIKTSNYSGNGTRVYAYTNYLMKNVYYNTGGMTQYSYTNVKKSFGTSDDDSMWLDGYKISKRVDYTDRNKTVSANQVKYYYIKDESGYPDSHTSDGNIYDTSMKYYVIEERVADDVEVNSSKTLHTFNYKHQKIREELTDKKYKDYILTNTGPGTGYNVKVYGERIFHRMTSGNVGYFLESKVVPDYTEEWLDNSRTKILSNNTSISMNGIVQEYGGKLYVFSKEYKNGGYVINVRAYDYSTAEWDDYATVSGNYGDYIFTGDKLCIKYYNDLYIYNFKTDVWTSRTVSSISGYTFLGCDRYNDIIYLYDSLSNIYHLDIRNSQPTLTKVYDPDFGMSTIKHKVMLDSNVYMFPYTGNEVYKYSGSSGEVTTLTANMPIGEKTASIYVANNTIYACVSVSDSQYERGIYAWGTDRLGNNIWNFQYPLSTDFSAPYSICVDGYNVFIAHNNVTEKFTIEPEVDAVLRSVEYSYDEYDLVNQTVKKIYSRAYAHRTDTTAQTHNAYGDVLTYTDVEGNTTTYTYPEVSRGIPLTVTQNYFESDKVDKTENTLSEDGYKIVSTVRTYSDNSTQTSEYTYDETYSGNVTSIKMYDGSGETKDLLNATKYEYSPEYMGAYITKTTLYDSNESADTAISETTEYYLDTGLIKTKSDAMGLGTSYVYEPSLKNALKQITYPDGSKEEYYYYFAEDVQRDSKKNIVCTKSISNDSAKTYTVANYLDGLGRCIDTCEVTVGECSEPKINKGIVSYTYTRSGKNIATQKAPLCSPVNYYYDVLGRTVGTSQITADGVATTSVSYDDEENEKNIHDGYDNRHYYRYDKAGRVKLYILIPWAYPQGEASTNYTYDEKGNLLSEVGEHADIYYTYDGKGRVMSTTDDLDQITSYTYDAWGNVLTITNPAGKVITNEYDDFGRLLSTTDTYGKTESYTYDKVGNVLTYTDKTGTVTTMTYEYQVSGNPASYRINNVKTGDMDATEYTYDGFGNVLTEGIGNDIIRYTYTDDNLLSTVKYSDNKMMSYTYDAGGKVISKTDYDGNEYDYIYDDAALIRYVRRNGSFFESYSYYGNGALKSVGTPYGRTEYLAYDGYGNPLEVSEYVGDTLKEHCAYAYDRAGNLTYSDAFGETILYTYDDLHRVTKEQKTGVSTTEYTYNANNDIVLKTITHDAGDMLTFNPANGNAVTIDNISTHTVQYGYSNANAGYQVVETISNTQSTNGNYSGTYTVSDVYLCNANTGNLTIHRHNENSSGMTTESYGYNAKNQMISHSKDGVTTSYVYYPDGLRKSKQTGDTTTTFYYEGGNIVNEAVNGTMSASNVFGVRGITARYIDDDVYYMHKDQHGDVEYLLDSAGQIVSDYKYDAFGEQTNTVVDINPFRYSGEYYDAETGFIYLRNRYYNPATGRFTQMDPAKDGLNWYVYCGNNPVNAWDPWGLVVTQEDEMYLDKYEIQLIEQYTTDYETAEKNGDYVGMNIARQNAVSVRQANYDYEDTFDYTHGGKIYTYEYTYNEFRTIHHDGSGRFFPTTANVYILNLDGSKTAQAAQADKQSLSENDYAVIDYRDDANPNVQIRNSYNAGKDIRFAVVDILLEHESNYPTNWHRDRESMENEWYWHNAAYGFFYEQNRTAHVDLDNADATNYPRWFPW